MTRAEAADAASEQRLGAAILAEPHAPDVEYVRKVTIEAVFHYMLERAALRLRRLA